MRVSVCCVYLCVCVPFKQQLHDFTEARVSTVPCAYFPRIAHEFYCIICIERERESERAYGIRRMSDLSWEPFVASQRVSRNFQQFTLMLLILLLLFLDSPHIYPVCYVHCVPYKLLTHMYNENRTSCVPDNTSLPKFVITTNKTTSKKSNCTFNAHSDCCIPCKYSMFSIFKAEIAFNIICILMLNPLDRHE